MNLSKKACVFSVLAIFSLISGCATMSSNKKGGEDSYLESAKKNFDKAEGALQNEQFEEAISFFEHVRSRFPYSQYVALSDLKIADSHFAQKKWLDAADSYDFFIRLHPRHKMIDQAYFKMAKSYFEAIPDNFFLFPKSYKRDQKATNDALKAINEFLDRFEGNAMEKEALRIKNKILEELARAEISVAKFYSNRKKWSGAFARFNKVAKDYPTTKVAAQALFESAKIARNHLGDPKKSSRLFQATKAQLPKIQICRHD